MTFHFFQFKRTCWSRFYNHLVKQRFLTCGLLITVLEPSCKAAVLNLRGLPHKWSALKFDSWAKIQFCLQQKFQTLIEEIWIKKCSTDIEQRLRSFFCRWSWLMTYTKTYLRVNILLANKYSSTFDVWPMVIICRKNV